MTKLSGRYAMMEQLAAEGVRYVFGNPGTTEQAFMDALQDYQRLEYILALHEGVALGIADGYARATGRPAFVQLHITPGLGNAMGMLYNSYRSHTPLVIYAGQHPQRGASQEPILAGDLVRLARPLTNWAVEAQDAQEIPVLLRRAFKVAMDPPRGPVFVSIPTNLMDEEADTVITASSPMDTRVRPDPEAVERAARLLAEAQSPIIICGDGVATSGGQAELVQLAETIGARVHAAFTAELPFPSSHPLYAGLLNVISAPGLKGQLSAADVILAVGTPLMPLLFPLDESPLPDKTAVIHIDLDAWEIGKNWPVQIGLLADPRQALAEIIAALQRLLTSEQREAARRRAAAVQAMADQLMQALEGAARARWDNVPMSAGRMMSELGAALAPDTLLFDESITAGGYLMRYLRFPDTGRHYRASGGGLGPGMPNPIGIKLARPDRPVLSVVGDGAALYTIQALWTAAHHKVPVTWVVANNASYRILKLNMLEYLGEGAAGRGFVAMDLTDPPLDFSRLAAAFGVKGVRVEHPDQVGDAVHEAQAAAEPRLVDVAIEGDVRSRWF
ncbi:MAG TPA: thiamine pyrophosphate-binding protein [Dehalococcoidia bacterium]|nr:thiamine pyrophosphate-binding protein [Dehalococcoidia bacterium]